MVDADTVGVAGAALVLARGLARVAGPSVRELGDALGRLTEFRLRNLGSIVEQAADRGSDEPLVVAPRVLHRLVEGASYIDDPLMQAYVAGVLIGARTTSGEDDRAVTWLALIGRLSAVQVRLHYVGYREFARYADGSDMRQGLATVGGSLYLPGDELGVALGVEGDWQEIAVHATNGLEREGLALVDFRVDRDLDPAGPADGLQFDSSTGGLELYLWAHGRPFSPDGLRQLDFDLPGASEVPGVPGCRAL